MEHSRALFDPAILPPRSTANVEPAYDTNTVVVRIREKMGQRGTFGIGRMPVSAPADDLQVLQSLIDDGYISRIAPAYIPISRRRQFAAHNVSDAPVSPTVRELVSLSITTRGDAHQIADFLNGYKEELVYAYVPAIKRPCANAGPDPFRSLQWGHTAVRVDDARALPKYRDGSEIMVAIVDTGIDTTHPDLAGTIAIYQNFLSSETDDDFVGHGTHVAGIIGAGINNGIGIAGVSAARLAVLKALPRRGGIWDANAYYRALGASADIGAKVVNLSLGGAFDRGEADIVEDLLNAGIVVVAAMGNEYERGNPTFYPSAYDGVIAVGAVDEADRRASFSCTGPHIALMAPGVNILSTVPQHPTSETQKTMYDSWNGTSMATPYVSAAAALILAENQMLTPSEVRVRLIESADPIRWPSSDSAVEYGAGRLNIFAALQ